MKPVVFSEVYPLERVSECLKALEERKTWGKAIIRIRPDDDDDSAYERAKL